jgi:hypothetical protein
LSVITPWWASLIAERITDRRPGLLALPIDPFVPCVTYWYTIYLSLHAVLFRPRVKIWTICFAMPGADWPVGLTGQMPGGPLACKAVLGPFKFA